MSHFSLPAQPRIALLRQLLQAASAHRVTLAGMRVLVPGTLPIRLSVVLSNLRMQRMFDILIQPGATVVDVGANIGYNTLYAAYRTGPRGVVYAVEPAQDNLAVLYTNLFANNLRNIVVLPYAAGSANGLRRFFLRGDTSAVNSLFADNFYAPVTNTVEVLAAPLDDLISGGVDVVKIDVEGGELEVLQGMPRLLDTPRLRLIIEWHPVLQKAAGHQPDELPRYLLSQGFMLQMVSHTHSALLGMADLPLLTSQLLKSRRPVELLATR